MSLLVEIQELEASIRKHYKLNVPFKIIFKARQNTIEMTIIDKNKRLLSKKPMVLLALQEGAYINSYLNINYWYFINTYRLTHNLTEKELSIGQILIIIQYYYRLFGTYPVTLFGN